MNVIVPLCIRCRKPMSINVIKMGYGGSCFSCGFCGHKIDAEIVPIKEPEIKKPLEKKKQFENLVLAIEALISAFEMYMVYDDKNTAFLEIKNSRRILRAISTEGEL